MLARATGPALEGEARPGRPLSDSESREAGPGFLTRIPPQTGRGKTCGPEHEPVLTEPAAGITPPCWDCSVAPTWMDQNLLFRDLKERTNKDGDSILSRFLVRTLSSCC